ncbi:MAG: hypothetical protein KDA24_28135 [Deltaproteobacteria bacterium]|nr:hypothetical protein [Deltaproteobacteria bacterium]
MANVRFLQMILLSAACTTFLGCPATGSDDDDSSGDDDDATAGPTVTVSGSLEDLIGGAPNVAHEVCVVEHPDVACVTTDGQGAFSLEGVPANSTVTVMNGPTFEYLGVAVPVMVGEADVTLRPWQMVTQLAVDLQFALYNVEYVDGTGILQFYPGNGIDGDGLNAIGLTGSLSPEAGVGPQYVTENGNADPDGTETSGAGGVAWVNVPVGDYVVTILGEDCVQQEETAYGEPSGGGWAVQAFADTLTAVWIECPSS